MTNDEIPKPEGNAKPEARNGGHPLFGLGRLGLPSSLGISSFVIPKLVSSVKVLVYEARPGRPVCCRRITPYFLPAS